MLKQGEVIAFKTDTVWGFGCNIKDEVAVNKIYEIKKRDPKKPLIIMSDEYDSIKKYIDYIPDYAHDIMEEHLPGALTLIFKKSFLCPDYITAGGNTIGIRIPDSEDFRNIIANIPEGALATTSCNIAGEPPVLNYKEAKEKFGHCATIIKPIEDTESENIPSTVILCKENKYEILRQGAVTL